MNKRKLLILLVMILLLVLAAGGAQAGWFGKKDQEEKAVKAHRYNYFPSMSFHLGTLRRDNYAGWQLDETNLQFTSGVKVTQGGLEVNSLREGDQALVMGSRIGETIVVWRVRLLEPDLDTSRNTPGDRQVTWSTADSTVGEGPTTE